jgi:hypothetical protein
MKFFRPTETTRFHVDYAWFDKNGQDVNVLIFKCLTPEQQENLEGVPLGEQLDFIDAETGEVQRVTRVVQMIRTERADDPEFIGPRMPVSEAVFRTFLLNNNQPLTPIELANKIGRKPAEILAQLSGRSIYNGVRPILE